MPKKSAKSTNETQGNGFSIRSSSKIVPCLWFNNEAEDAVYFYITLFPNSRILNIMRYTDAGPGAAGSILSITFELDGCRFMALNGGSDYRFTPAISMFVHCSTQKEVDKYWEKLSEGGTKERCGWLRDRYGLSWQVVPDALEMMLNDLDPNKASRVMKTLLKMSKINLKRLEQVYSK